MEKEFDFHSPRQKNLFLENDHERFAKLKTLEDALRHSWNADCCIAFERPQWTPAVPAFGQCAVTALVIQDFFGGSIIKDPENDHYWNRLDDGTEVDLTREQFPIGLAIVAREVRSRSQMLDSERACKARTKERYVLLRERVMIYLLDHS